MTGKATVISVSGKYATVEAERMSACEGCHRQNGDGGCSVCSLLGGERTLRARAYNAAGAAPGDTVTVESGSGRMLWYAALVFILPVVAGIAAYLVAARFTSAELTLTLSALGGFVIAFCAAAAYSAFLSKRSCDVKVTEIVTSPGKDGKSATDS